MKLKRVLAALVTAAVIITCMAGCGKKEEANVNIGVLKGPTGMGAISLMDEANNGVYEKYNFTLTPDVSDIVARLTNGDLDIGALPTNTAVNLYNKTNGDVQLIAINCTGVLYILENGNSINSVKDLKGKTLLCNGQGSNPEYVINFLLKQNGLEPGVDVDIQFKEASEITQLMVSGQADCCMLPVPAVTTICIKNKDVRKALNVTDEWSKAATDGSQLTMGCLVATKKFITEHPADVKLFVERYEKSIQAVLADVDAAAELVAKYEITGSAAIAKNAIPDAGIVCITGKDMKPAINGYYQVLFDANPASLGGKMPADDFYYAK
ncbi:MAG: ABC transporter substrate-binding protein [Lachnospiraceae bacterium]|nr:ABC transporter substrate-binding protein [Lachnospiraceae bacterium]